MGAASAKEEQPSAAPGSTADSAKRSGRLPGPSPNALVPSVAPESTEIILLGVTDSPIAAFDPLALRAVGHLLGRQNLLPLETRIV